MLSFAAGFSWVGLIVTKVFSGSGLEHCCNIGGVSFNFMGAFVLLCGAAIALIVAGILQVRDWLAWRELKDRYGIVRVSARRTHLAAIRIE